MRAFIIGLVSALALGTGASTQGPGHTRALGVGAGTAAGAAIGAAASPHNRGGGALVGGVMGMIGGALIGDGIASDQERCTPCEAPPPPCRSCRRRTRPAPCPVPRRTVIRRRVFVVEDGVRYPVEETVEEVTEEGPGQGG